MTVGIILSIICMTFSGGPDRLANACSGVSGGEDIFSCIEAPACLVRLTENEYAVYVHAWRGEDSEVAAISSFKTEHLDLAGGVEWSGVNTSLDILTAVISVAKTLRGNPIGFMSGIFGPSISMGAGLDFEHTGKEDESTSQLSALAGIQFSVFPTIAMGAQISGLTLYSTEDEEWDPIAEYGITCIFDRNLKVHLTVLDETLSFGADLAVTSDLTVRSGSDGSGWNFGASLDTGGFTVNYGVFLETDACTHSLGIILRSGGVQ